jgi:hypothetical protein
MCFSLSSSVLHEPSHHHFSNTSLSCASLSPPPRWTQMIEATTMTKSSSKLISPTAVARCGGGKRTLHLPSSFLVVIVAALLLSGQRAPPWGCFAFHLALHRNAVFDHAALSKSARSRQSFRQQRHHTPLLHSLSHPQSRRPSRSSVATSAHVDPSDVSGKSYDLAIIGAGPVGVSSALLAASSHGANVILIDAPRASGALMNEVTGEDLSLGGPTGLFSKALRASVKKINVGSLRGMGLRDDSVWNEVVACCVELASFNARDALRQLDYAGVTVRVERTNYYYHFNALLAPFFVCGGCFSSPFRCHIIYISPLPLTDIFFLITFVLPKFH